MKMLSKRAMAVMALVLLAATAATAATALAGERKKAVFKPQVVAETVNLTSRAILQAKVRALRYNPSVIRVAFAVPK